MLAYREGRQRLAADFDFSPAPYLIGYDRPELGQWSEELRLHSGNEDAKLKWSVGAFAAGRTVDRDNGYRFGPYAALAPHNPPPGTIENRHS